MRPCPKPACRKTTRVYGQKVEQGMVIRYRRCKACGHTFKTITPAEEVVIEDHEDSTSIQPADLVS